MFFADGYSNWFVGSALRWVEAGRPELSIYSSAALRYIYIAMKRFTQIYSGSSLEVGTHHTDSVPHYRRRPSINNSGIGCSLEIARSMRPWARSYPIDSDTWIYRAEEYKSFYEQVFARRLFRIEPPLAHIGVYEAEYNDLIVGIQIGLFDRRGDNFHTVCLFRRSGQWYIGDDMVGYAFPILPNPSIADLSTMTLLHTSETDFGDMNITEILKMKELERMYRYRYQLYSDASVVGWHTDTPYGPRTRNLSAPSAPPIYSKNILSTVDHAAYSVEVCEDKSSRLYYYSAWANHPHPSEPSSVEGTPRKRTRKARRS